MLDYFIYYLFPLALKIGMTPQQFWDDDPDLMGAYLEAYRQKLEEKMEYDNALAYLQGKYFLFALAQCMQFKKPIKDIYPKKPFTIGESKSKKMTKQEYEEIRKIQLQHMVKKFNKDKK